MLDVCVSVCWAAATTYPSLGGLFSGGWKSKFRVLSGLLSDEASLPGLRTAPCPLCPHVVFLRCAERDRERVPVSFAYKNASSVRLGPYLMNLFNLHYLPKAIAPKYSYIGD